MVGDGYAGPEMTNASYKGVLFDLDDTLIDRKSAYDALYRRFYDEQPAIHNDVSWDVAREFLVAESLERDERAYGDRGDQAPLAGR